MSGFLQILKSDSNDISLDLFIYFKSAMHALALYFGKYFENYSR